MERTGRGAQLSFAMKIRDTQSTSTRVFCPREAEPCAGPMDGLGVAGWVLVCQRPPGSPWEAFISAWLPKAPQAATLLVLGCGCPRKPAGLGADA